MSSTKERETMGWSLLVYTDVERLVSPLPEDQRPELKIARVKRINRGSRGNEGRDGRGEKADV